MTLRTQLIMYLYNVFKSDTTKYTKVPDLLDTLKKAQSCSDAEFYQEIAYFEELEYVKYEAAGYKITGKGIKYIEQNITNVELNPEKKSLDLQAGSNYLASCTLVVGILALLIAFITIIIMIYPDVFKKDTAQINPVSIVEPLEKNIGNINDSDVWFIKPYQAMPNYVLETIDKPITDDFERLVSYSRLYRHPSDCQSNGIRGILVQVIFFKSDSGSRAYFTNAYAAIKNTKPNITNSVGETSYFRTYPQNDSHCGGEASDKYSLIFQRYNAVGIVISWAVPNSIDDNSVQGWLNQIGSELDATFKENYK